MATALDQLSIARYAGLYTTALMGDLDAQAAIKDLVVKAQDSIVIKPNSGYGAHASKNLKIFGTAHVDGALQVDNVTVDGNSVRASGGPLTVSSDAGSVRVSDVVVAAASVAPASDVDLTIAGGATKSVLVEGVKFTDNDVTTASGTMSLSSGGSAANALRVGGVTVTDASVSTSTSNGNLSLASNGAGAVLLDNVRVKTSGISNSVADADLALSSNGTGSVTVDNVKVKGTAVSTSSGTLALSSAGSSANALQVGGVVVTDASVSSATANGDLSAVSNGTGAVLLDNVRVKTSGISNKVANADLTLSSNGTGAVVVDNVRVKASGIGNNVANADLTLSSNGTGSVLVDNIKLKTSGISNNVANADLTLSSNGTGSVVVDNVKVKTAGITTSSGTLSLTSAGSATAQVNVGGLTVTNASLSTAGTTVTVAKDLALTSTAGGSGKLTTSAGNLELTSVGGTVAVTGALTGSSSITSTGNTVVGGDLKVAGVIDSTNPTGNLEIVDKTVKLGYQSGSATIVDCPFTTKVTGPMRTPNSASSGVVMYLGGSADIVGGSLVIPASGAANYATTGTSDPSSYSSAGVLNWSTDNVQIEFPITITSALTATGSPVGCPLFFMENYTSTNQLYVRLYAKGTTGVLRVEGKGVDSDAVGFLSSAGTYLFRMSTSWSGGVCLATMTYSKDGGATVPITFGGSSTIDLTNRLDGCVQWALTMGASGYTPNQQFSFDYFKLTKGAASTNAPSDNAGLYVDGSASFGSRALTWHMGASETSQDKGDHTGSYWHIEGGQLLLSRTIQATDREAPGTNVSLASLASGSDAIRWEFTSSKSSTVGSATLSGTGTVADGVLKESGSQFDTVSPGITGTFSFITKVIPQFDLSTIAILTDLIVYGYLQVQIESGGRLAFSDGVNAPIVMTSSVADQPFTLCVTMSGSEVKFYLDGALVASSSNGLLGPSPQLVLNGGYVGDIWYDDVRFVSGQAITDSTTMLYGWREMYAANQTVTYGFRISNNEGLQLVKVRGSGGNGWVGINPSPNTIGGGNTLGAIGSSKASIVTESQMSY